MKGEAELRQTLDVLSNVLRSRNEIHLESGYGLTGLEKLLDAIKQVERSGHDALADELCLICDTLLWVIDDECDRDPENPRRVEELFRQFSD